MDNIVKLNDYRIEVYNMLLNDYTSIWGTTARNCGRDLLLSCVNLWACRYLAYNKKTGHTFDRDGLQAKYVNKKDIPQYNNDSSCAFWEFSGFICNSISRVQKGFKAI